MKVMAIIPLLVAGCVGAAALILKLSGLHMNLADPIAAIAVASLAAMVGALPILLTKETDSASIVQRALVGTVVHGLATIVFAGIPIAAHLETLHGAFIYWVLGAYWVSLVVLVTQLRLLMLRLISNASNQLKVQN